MIAKFIEEFKNKKEKNKDYRGYIKTKISNISWNSAVNNFIIIDAENTSATCDIISGTVIGNTGNTECSNIKAFDINGKEFYKADEKKEKIEVNCHVIPMHNGIIVRLYYNAKYGWLLANSTKSSMKDEKIFQFAYTDFINSIRGDLFATKSKNQVIDEYGSKLDKTKTYFYVLESKHVHTIYKTKECKIHPLIEINNSDGKISKISAPSDEVKIFKSIDMNEKEFYNKLIDKSHKIGSFIIIEGNGDGHDLKNNGLRPFMLKCFSDKFIELQKFYNPKFSENFNMLSCILNNQTKIIPDIYGMNKDIDIDGINTRIYKSAKIIFDLYQKQYVKMPELSLIKKGKRKFKKQNPSNSIDSSISNIYLLMLHYHYCMTHETITIEKVVDIIKKSHIANVSLLIGIPIKT